MKEIELRNELDRLRAENAQLHHDKAVLQMAVALWDATFSRYVSWQANQAKPREWPAAVVSDYRKCAKVTSYLWQDDGYKTITITP